ncbi:MAG: ATP-binding protein [Bryobacteraceae bacterium]
MNIRTVATSELRLETLYGLNAAVARCHAVQEIAAEAVRALMAALPVDRVSVLIADADGVMRFKAWEGLSEEYRKAVEGHSPWGPGAIDPPPVLVEDVLATAEMASYLPIFEREGLRALGFIPLLAQRRVIGKFMLYHNKPHKFTSGEIQFATAVANHVAVAIERRLAEDQLLSANASLEVRIAERVKQLQELNLQLATAQRLSNLGSWEWQIDPDTVHWSDELYRIYGLEPQSVPIDFEFYLGLIHPADRHLVVSHVQEALQTHKEFMFEHRIVRPDGDVRVLCAQGQVVEDERGEAVRMFGIGQDITERKRAEQERERLLREQAARASAEASEQRARFLAQASTILSASLEYEPTLQSLAHISVPEFADWCTIDVLREDGALERIASAHAEPDQAAYLSELNRRYPPNPDAKLSIFDVVRTQTPHFYPHLPDEILRQAAQDDEHCAVLRSLNLTSAICVPLVARGRSLGAITFCRTGDRTFDDADFALARDLANRASIAMDNSLLYSASQRERAELQSALEALRTANQDLEQFAYIASHDLREPLRTIASYVQMLQRRYSGRLDEDADEFIGFVVKGVHRMNDLLSDLLQYARAVSVNEAPSLEMRSAGEALNTAINDLQAAIAESGAVIECGALPQVRANHRQLTQVFANLLSNAIKYRGNLQPHIRIWAEQDGPMWVFCVRDNGIGISPEHRDRVFQFFKRLHGTEYPGTGMGLAICKTIIERHRGRIWFESKAGEGTTFRFSLPAL